jgi:hypothetical protein
VNYLDFDIALRPKAADGSVDAYARSQAGEASALVNLNLDSTTLRHIDGILRQGGPIRGLRPYVTALSDPESDLRQFGQSLFQSVFADDIRSLFTSYCRNVWKLSAGEQPGGVKGTA